MSSKRDVPEMCQTGPSHCCTTSLAQELCLRLFLPVLSWGLGITPTGRARARGSFAAPQMGFFISCLCPGSGWDGTSPLPPGQEVPVAVTGLLGTGAGTSEGSEGNRPLPTLAKRDFHWGCLSAAAPRGISRPLSLPVPGRFLLHFCTPSTHIHPSISIHHPSIIPPSLPQLAQTPGAGLKQPCPLPVLSGGVTEGQTPWQVPLRAAPRARGSPCARGRG